MIGSFCLASIGIIEIPLLYTNFKFCCGTTDAARDAAVVLTESSQIVHAVRSLRIAQLLDVGLRFDDLYRHLRRQIFA
jgi:hypothetical protein